MTKIPPVDLQRQYQLISDRTLDMVAQVLASGRYIGGTVVSDFEQQFATYLGVSDCIGCNSGTDALYLALRALNIGAGDEVITPTFTFIATAEMVTMAGATPVFVDIDINTFNLDVNKLKEAITPRTKAIIPVHLFGQPVAMTELMAIARQHNLYVIEDCAQATGAEWDGKQVGTIGDIGCFSFFPTKNLGCCGDGGAVTTNNGELAAKMRMIKEHGSKTRYLHEEVGINSRLDAIQAAILQVKLPLLDHWNQQRTAIAENYHQLLQSLPGITLPQATPGGKHVWNQYTILIKSQEGKSEILRDRIREQLDAKGVSSMIYYPLPLHLQPVYQDLDYQQGQCAIAEQAANEVLSLPMFPDLTLEEQERVAYALKESLKS